MRTVGQHRVTDTTPASSHRLAFGTVAAAIAVAVALLVLRSPLGERSSEPRHVPEGTTPSNVPIAPSPNGGVPAVTANVPLTYGDPPTYSPQPEPPIEDPTPARVAATPHPEESIVRVSGDTHVAQSASADSPSGGLPVLTIPSGLPTSGVVAAPIPGRASTDSVNRQVGTLQAAAGDAWLHFSALDRTNAPVLGLGRESVTVFEDGVARKITYFTDQQPPLAVSLVVDKSIKTVAEQPAVMEALSAFVNGRGPDDLTQIVNFSDSNLNTFTTFTRDRDVLERLIRREPYGQVVTLREALSLALRLQGTRRAEDPDTLRRAAIIVFSGSEDDTKNYPADQVVGLARRIDAEIYVLAAGPTSKTRRDVPMLTTLTRDTGGELFVVSSPEEIASAYRWIASDLASQYVLGYDSPKSARPYPRQVEVKISRPDVAARARRVYSPEVLTNLRIPGFDGPVTR